MNELDSIFCIVLLKNKLVFELPQNSIRYTLRIVYIIRLYHDLRKNLEIFQVRFGIGKIGNDLQNKIAPKTKARCDLPLPISSAVTGERDAK